MMKGYTERVSLIMTPNGVTWLGLGEGLSKGGYVKLVLRVSIRHKDMR